MRRLLCFLGWHKPALHPNPDRARVALGCTRCQWRKPTVRFSQEKKAWLEWAEGRRAWVPVEFMTPVEWR